MNKKTIIFFIAFGIIVVSLILQRYFPPKSTYNFYSSGNINNFDSELILQAQKTEYKPNKNPHLQISKITEIDENTYIVFYNDSNKYFNVFKKIMAKNLAESFYTLSASSQNYDCLTIKKLNIPFDYLASNTSINCPNFRYDNYFSLTKATSTNSNILNIYPESAVVESEPSFCVNSNLGSNCNFVKLLIEYSTLEGIYVIFSNNQSNYFNKYKNSITETIFNYNQEIVKTSYLNDKNFVSAVSFCNKNFMYCLSFESIDTVEYDLGDFGVNNYLTFINGKYKLWNSTDDNFNIENGGNKKSTLKQFLDKNINLPIPIIADNTIYLGKQNSISCDEHRILYPESANTPDNQLKFRCNYVYYTFAISKDYMSFNEVSDIFTNGLDGFTLHGGAGDYNGSRFGGLRYENIKKTEGMDDYYLSISNSNPKYVIYKVSYDPR